METGEWRNPIDAFNHVDRCHICGCEFDDGDHVLMLEVTEVYVIDRAPKKKFKLQWHRECGKKAVVN